VWPPRLPERDKLLEPGPYLVGRIGVDGGVRVVLRRGLTWLRACRLVDPLPEDYGMRLEASEQKEAQR
jgi:hypothetical protein